MFRGAPRPGRATHGISPLRDKQEFEILYRAQCQSRVLTRQQLDRGGGHGGCAKPGFHSIQRRTTSLSRRRTGDCHVNAMRVEIVSLSFGRPLRRVRQRIESGCWCHFDVLSREVGSQRCDRRRRIQVTFVKGGGFVPRTVSWTLDWGTQPLRTGREPS